MIERFNRSLKGDMFKYFSANSTRNYVKILPALVHRYNNREVRWVRRDTRLTIRVTVWGRGLGGAKSQRGGTTPTPVSARPESGARADWQACTTHVFLLDHRTSCTVFRAMVVFAMTTIARSCTTHLTSFVVHRVRFGPDSRQSGPNPGTGLT